MNGCFSTKNGLKLYSVQEGCIPVNKIQLGELSHFAEYSVTKFSKQVAP